MLLFSDVSAGISNFPCFDGNGSIVSLVSATSGLLSGTYENGAFGEPLLASGSEADANPFRFSSKYIDSESNLLYYGQRYYNPGTGRWLSRDPINEAGGANRYGFCTNDPINKWDYLGMDADIVARLNAIFESLKASEHCTTCDALDKDLATVNGYIISDIAALNQSNQLLNNANAENNASLAITGAQGVFTLSALAKELGVVGARYSLEAIPGSAFGGSVPLQAGLPNAGGIVGVGSTAFGAANSSLTIAKNVGYATIAGKEIANEVIQDQLQDAVLLVKVALDPFGQLAEDNIAQATVLSDVANNALRRMTALKQAIIAKKMANGCP